MEKKTVKELIVLCKANKLKGCYGRKTDIIKKLKDAGVTLEPKRTGSRSKSPKRKTLTKEKVVYDKRKDEPTTKVLKEGYFAIIAKPSRNDWTLDVYNSIYTDKKALFRAYNKVICNQIENRIERYTNLSDLNSLRLYNMYSTDYVSVIYFKPLGVKFYVELLINNIGTLGNFSLIQFADKDAVIEESKNPETKRFTLAYIDTTKMKQNSLNPITNQTTISIQRGIEYD